MYLRRLTKIIRLYSSHASISHSESVIQGSKSEIASKVDVLGRSYGTGRRKTSIARVWIKDGSGQFVINNKSSVDYFQPIQREHCIGPFIASKTAGLFDIWCTVKGGGMSGQAGAIRLGIGRALQNYSPELKPILRNAGMLTRDSRKVERKKPGQKKARKQYQWVKR